MRAFYKPSLKEAVEGFRMRAFEVLLGRDQLKNFHYAKRSFVRYPPLAIEPFRPLHGYSVEGIPSEGIL